MVTGDCAELGCADFDAVGQAKAIRDACMMLLEEVKAGLDTMTVRDGQQLVSYIREIRGWLNGVQDQLANDGKVTQ